MNFFGQREPKYHHCTNCYFISLSEWDNHILPSVTSCSKKISSGQWKCCKINLKVFTWYCLTFLVGIKTFWHQLGWQHLHNKLLMNYKPSTLVGYLECPSNCLGQDLSISWNYVMNMIGNFRSRHYLRPSRLGCILDFEISTPEVGMPLIQNWV